MVYSLLLTAFLMGLAGGPHCVAMCGAACAGVAQLPGASVTWRLASFHIARTLGYATLGAVAAASLHGLGWLTVHAAFLRPVWTLFHVAILLFGLLLLLRAQQPVWLERTGQTVWRTVKSWAARRGQGAPWLLGYVWALLPCGLLYSAVLVAAMAGSAGGGALTMACFALGTTVSLGFGPWLLMRSRRAHSLLKGQWGVRLAGGALATSAVAALWLSMFHNAAPWCVT